ncbi:hypothetical protein PNK_2130 [Candidatus Protochlamydia naegleriophila]|uniref:Uncharacterized protein n=1 Tax=Candidatus Protochlamydia naegleriophila TaxID=389348 RepID=A0A0U5JIB7_9BACT|nr:hypothetical protein PNK_2130 [Candidatus Protochlamydia naegleriophila]
MGLISYLSYGWNKLFSSPTVAPQQDSQDLKEFKMMINLRLYEILLKWVLRRDRYVDIFETRT